MCLFTDGSDADAKAWFSLSYTESYPGSCPVPEDDVLCSSVSSSSRCGNEGDCILSHTPQYHFLCHFLDARLAGFITPKHALAESVT